MIPYLRRLTRRKGKYANAPRPDFILLDHLHEAEAHTPQEQTALQRQIEATDEQIDTLVYELYELTEEEIRIVEGMCV